MKESINAKKYTLETLVSKGFNRADIHFFVQRFGIGIYVSKPPTMMLQMALGSPDKQREAGDAHFEAQQALQREKWEAASIAADFERPK